MKEGYSLKKLRPTKIEVCSRYGTSSTCDFNTVGTGNCQLTVVESFASTFLFITEEKELIQILKCNPLPLILIDIRMRIYHRLVALSPSILDHVVLNSIYTSTNGSIMNLLIINTHNYVKQFESKLGCILAELT
jgi:hypothetical protein